MIGSLAVILVVATCAPFFELGVGVADVLGPLAEDRTRRGLLRAGPVRARAIGRRRRRRAGVSGLLAAATCRGSAQPASGQERRAAAERGDERGRDAWRSAWRCAHDDVGSLGVGARPARRQPSQFQRPTSGIRS